MDYGKVITHKSYYNGKLKSEKTEYSIPKLIQDRSHIVKEIIDCLELITNHQTSNVEIIVENIDEELSFLVEMETIDAYKKRGITLSNLTNGGEGASGLIHSEEHKAKLKGNKFFASTWGKNFKGKTHSDEQKAKWAVTRKGVT